MRPKPRLALGCRLGLGPPRIPWRADQTSIWKFGDPLRADSAAPGQMWHRGPNRGLRSRFSTRTDQRFSTHLAGLRRTAAEMHHSTWGGHAHWENVEAHKLLVLPVHGEGGLDALLLMWNLNQCFKSADQLHWRGGAGRGQAFFKFNPNRTALRS